MPRHTFPQSLTAKVAETGLPALSAPSTRLIPPILFSTELERTGETIETHFTIETVVVLAAVEQMQPQWIFSDDAFKLIKGSDGINDRNTGFPVSFPQATTLPKNARTLHREKFSKEKCPKKHVDWDSLNDYRGTFLSIWPQFESRARVALTQVFARISLEVPPAAGT